MSVEQGDIYVRDDLLHGGQGALTEEYGLKEGERVRRVVRRHAEGAGRVVVVLIVVMKNGGSDAKMTQNRVNTRSVSITIAAPSARSFA